MSEFQLPPLPTPDRRHRRSEDDCETDYSFSSDLMQAYGRQAILHMHAAYAHSQQQFLDLAVEHARLLLKRAQGLVDLRMLVESGLHPMPGRGLTDERIIEIRDEHMPDMGDAFDCIAFARAIEKAAKG